MENQPAADQEMQNEDQLDRQQMMKMSISDKKIQALIDHKDEFLKQMADYKNTIKTVEVQDEREIKIVEGRDIDVCIRARPLLEHEINDQHFEVTHAQHPEFHFMEPKLNLKQLPTITPTSNLVDFAFGGEDQN